MLTRPRPCEECPWRRDTPPGQFPASRYEALRGTSGEQGAEAALDAPIFACHKSTQGAPLPCAGWLAAVGRDHLGVRLRVTAGDIPPEALDPGDDWPDLFDTYDEMAAAMAGPDRRRG